jgi:hypothetical protein
MRGLLTGLLLAVLVAAAPAHAAEPGPPYDPLGFENPLSPVMRAYRDAPAPADALNLFVALNIRWFVTRQQVEEARRVRDVITAFYAQILRDNPELVRPFAEALGREGTGHHLNVGAGAIRVADPPNLAEALAAMKAARLARYEGDETDELEAALDKLIEQAMALPVFPYTAEPPRTRSEVDQLWAAFYAGGDELYLARLFDTLDDWPGRACVEALAGNASGGGQAEAGNARLALCPGDDDELDHAYLRTTEYVRHTLAKQAEADPSFAARLADFARRRSGTAAGLAQAIVSGQAGQ